MGYRSDVGFGCDPILKDILKTVTEWDKETKEFLEYGDDLSSDDHGRWSWNYVKWYETYPEIQVLENLMCFAENSSLDYDSYGFIRIGEEIDDIEMKGCPSTFDIYVSRSIDI